MIKKSFALKLFFLCCFFVTESFSQTALDAENKKIESIYTDPTKVLLVKKNNPHFTINLRSNPTTGFMWVLEGQYDSQIIKPLSHVFHPSTRALVGAPGYESFEFQASQNAFKVPQITRLVFHYVRPWIVVENSQKMEFTVVSSPSS